MNRNITLDYLSLVFSIFLYIFFIVVILYIAYSSETKSLPDIKYTKDKDAFMDVYMLDIDDFPTPVAPKETADKIDTKSVEKLKPDEEESTKTTNKPTKPQESKPTPKVEEKKPELDTEAISEEKPKEVEKKPKEDSKSLSDLFNDVDANKINETAKKEETAVQSRKKSDKETKSAEKKATSSQKADAKGDTARGKSQRTGVYDKFMGEIESILTNVWSTYRAMPNQDATVEITINPNGKLSYNIIELSYDTAFNQKLRDFLSRVERMNFPIPPDGKSYTHRYTMKDLIQ